MNTVDCSTGLAWPEKGNQSEKPHMAGFEGQNEKVFVFLVGMGNWLRGEAFGMDRGSLSLGLVVLSPSSSAQLPKKSHGVYLRI